MPSTLPLNTAPIDGLAVQSSEQQVMTMMRAIRQERGSKNVAIIAVVPDRLLYGLQGASVKRWWQFWRGSSLILLTTSEGLQDAIDQARQDRTRSTMIIMASTAIPNITLSVRSPVTDLQILRCGHLESPEGELIVSGSSQFHGVRLDEWCSKPRRGHTIRVSHGVHIKVGERVASSWFGFAKDLTGDQRQSVRDSLHEMQGANMNGRWWNEWKGPVASLMGVSVTGVKLGAALKASAGGFYFNFQTVGVVLQAGAAGAKMSAVASAAGPAFLLGAGTAALVYFLPWGCLLPTLQSALSTFWGWFTRLFTMFKDWVRSSAKAEPGRSRTRARRRRRSHRASRLHHQG